MVFGFISSPRDILSPLQALELAKVYLESAIKAKDHYIALVLCHDTEASLSQARKGSKGVEIQTMREEIIAAYMKLGDLLDSRGHRDKAQASYKRAEKLGGRRQENHRRKDQEQQCEPAQKSRSDILTLQPEQDQEQYQEIRQEADQETDQKRHPHHTQAFDQKVHVMPVETQGAKLMLPSTPNNQDCDIAKVPQAIFPKNARPLARQLKLPGVDERLGNTQQLASCLSLLRDAQLLDDILDPPTRKWLHTIQNDTDEQDRLKVLVTDVVRAFQRDELKDDKAVAEIVRLAPVLGKNDFQYLLKELSKGVGQSVLLDVHQLEGIAQLIHGADPSYLDADDLVRILELLSTRLRGTHNQSSIHAYQLTTAVSSVLDAMADIKVEGIDRVNIHEPLLSYLSDIKNSSDPYLVFQAAYAYQALLHVPDDEALWQAALRRTVKVAEGVSGLVSGVRGLDLSKFINGLKNIQQGLAGTSSMFKMVKNTYNGVTSMTISVPMFLEYLKEGLVVKRRLAWYPALRGAEMLLREGQLVTFKKFVCEAPCRRDPAFQWGVCQRLGEVAADPSWDVKTRRGAIAFLGEIYRNDTEWGNQASVKEWIIILLIKLSSSTESISQTHSSDADSLLRELEASADDERVALFHASRAKGPDAYPLRTHLPSLASPSLLDRVQQKPDVEGQIRLLRKQRLSAWIKSVYIPPLAKSGLQASDSSGFNLMAKVKEFLESDQKVFLLLGDSGAGKSTFNKALVCDLWKDYEKETGAIPLLINLPAMEKPELDMISKELRRAGFTESQIGELKAQRRFILICDGYDESQQSHNLYTTNRLNQPGEWNAKMMVSCRTEYLGTDYLDRFQPGDRNQPSESIHFQEAVITPFSRSQIQDYIDEYVSIHQPQWEANDYKEALGQIPGLQDLVRNPFLMSLSLEVLPRMMDPGQRLAASRVTKVALYDQFIIHWLERGKKRLGEKDLDSQARAAFDTLTNDGFTKNGIDFLKRLSVGIYREQDGQPIVQYSRYKDDGTWKAEFFGRNDEKHLLREACPLTRNGNQYRFIHRSLLEYGLTLAIFDPQDWKSIGSAPVMARRGSTSSVMSFEMNSAETLTRTIEQGPDLESPLARRYFVDESSLMQFLEERAQQEPIFKQQLLNYIELSKEDRKWRIAAANAITILVRIGVEFRFADLRGIQIPGADITSGVFESANLQGADLRKVNLRNAWIRQADLSDTLMSGAHFGELPFLKHDTWLDSCTFSPDGSSFVIGDYDGNITVYETSSWEKTWTLSGHTKKVRSVVYSPTGAHFVSASEDTTLRLWDTKTGTCHHVLTGHTKEAMSVVYSPQGDLVASGSRDKTVRIWEVETGDCRYMLSGHSDHVTSVVFSPDGCRIASGSMDSTARLWDVKTGALIHILCGHTMTITCVLYSPRGDLIVSAGGDMTLRVWDVRTGECCHVLTGHSDEISSAAYSPKDNQVATGSHDNTVRIWDMDSGECRRILQGHSSWVNTMTYSLQGDQLASAGYDMTVRVWDTESGECRHVLTGHLCSGLQFSPRGGLVASANADGTARLWLVGAGTSRSSANGHAEEIIVGAGAEPPKTMVTRREQI